VQWPEQFDNLHKQLLPMKKSDATVGEIIFWSCAMLSSKVKTVTLLVVFAVFWMTCCKAQAGAQTILVNAAGKPISTGTTMRNGIETAHQNSATLVDQITPIVKMTAEQRTYLLDILGSVRRVIEGTASLEAEEKSLLGEGRYSWPKNPKAPVRVAKSYLAKNFRLKGIALLFRRTCDGAAWSTAGLSVQPTNFPATVYAIGVPAEFFSDFRLEKAELSLRPEESIKRVNVFSYRQKAGLLSMTIEAREDLSSVKEKYPSSFHAIQFKK